MKKIVYFAVVLLLISSYAAVGIGTKAGETLESKTLKLGFSKPQIIEKQEYITLNVKEANNYIFNGGKPMLPVYTETIILPFGVKIDGISCNVKNVETMVLPGKIQPAPQPVIKSMETTSKKPVKDDTVYNSPDFFPDNWFTYNVGVGFDGNIEHKTLLTINTCPVRYSPKTDTVQYAKNIDLTIRYSKPNSDPFPATSEYDLVIIAPPEFTSDLQPLVEHKNSHGVRTILKTTKEIYNEYSGVDKPEKIKYFIKDALETWGVKYVLLVGGLKSLIWANPRDNVNYGDKHWRVPVRYSNLNAGEPGYLCDLYLADIYKEGGEFDNWDSNGNGIFAEWKGWKKDKLDLYPDVCLGRLACRNKREVRNVVDKIIHYENGAADPSWFKKMIVVSGDGFLDQIDLNFEWNTNGLPNGEYTIYAQSTNADMTPGPIDVTHVTLDKTQDTKLTFNHDDYKLIADYPKYPALPVAKIMSVSEGDVIGKDDYFYKPTEKEAYCNDHMGYANVEYKNGILHLRGKSYDPRPYGNVTNIHVWVENNAGTVVFSDWRNHTEMYYEGEWTTGEKLLHERAGALYYMPSDFQKVILWSSKGTWYGQQDVINAQNQGSGFTFFSGHGSPAVWANHYPGIPGNRKIGSLNGLSVIDLLGGPPFFPMEKLENDYKNPVVVVGGCHNSMFNVSLLTTLFDVKNKHMMHSYGNPTAECWSWWFTRLSKRGAIACIGNTGYGYGILGEWCTVGGLDNYITTEFFVQYGTNGHDILGEAYEQTLTEYINHFKGAHEWDIAHEKTVEQWVLLGDPSLKIGGYPASEENVKITVNSKNDEGDSSPGVPVQLKAEANDEPISYVWDLDEDGIYDDATGKTIQGEWDKPGVYWVSVKAIYNDKEVKYDTIVDIEKDKTPDKPVKPDGATSIKTGESHTYTSKAVDPYNDELYYAFDWGDGEQSIIGPVSSGETVTASHSWSSKGSYDVKVQAYDSYGQWSDWSEPLKVSITKSRDKTVKIWDLLNTFFEKHPNLFPVLQQLLGF